MVVGIFLGSVLQIDLPMIPSFKFTVAQHFLAIISITYFCTHWNCCR